MKRKAVLILMVTILCFGLMACGSKEETPAEENMQTEETNTTEAADETAEEETPVIDVEENSKLPIDEEFMVDQEPADTFDAFAQQIKDVVASKSIEALAGMAAYPVYVADSADSSQGKVIETRDDFMALGVDTVITEELIAAIAEVDPASLTESKAGYTMMNGEEGPSITFNQVDGVFGITGINY